MGEIVGWIVGCHSFQPAEKNGGDDGTRTRGLCRDSSSSDDGENEKE